MIGSPALAIYSTFPRYLQVSSRGGSRAGGSVLRRLDGGEITVSGGPGVQRP